LRDPEPKASEVWIKVTAAADLPRGPYEVSVEAPGGESGRLKLHVDDLPQVVGTTPKTNLFVTPPVNVWGAFDPPGETDAIEFEAKAGQTLVFDLAGKVLGSKANAVLTLADANGRVLASNNDFDGNDPLVAYAFRADGRYTIRVGELTLGGSADHFYRLSLGAFPYVTGYYPLSVSANT